MLLLLQIVMMNTLFAQRTHLITFCNEVIPLEQDFVQNKMMNVIKKQINVVNLPSLRKKANYYMPLIEKYLKAHNLHPDLKYIPVIESGFVSTAQSVAMARGMWQIMPATARGYGMVVSPTYDEREGFDKSTRVACQLLVDNYNTLKKLTGNANWPLALAAYNWGIGNMVNAVRKQGANYFTMKLNNETGLYVYKIIAVKELFEYPEIYNSKYGFNIFSDKIKPKEIKSPTDEEIIEDIAREVIKNNDKTVMQQVKEPKEELVLAHIKGNFKNFKDGDFAQIVLDEDLKTEKNGMSFKGYSFGAQGWIIDDRIYFKLGYGHDVTLLDKDMEKGVLLGELKKNKSYGVVLRNYTYE